MKKPIPLSIVLIIHDPRWNDFSWDCGAIERAMTQILRPREYGEVSLVFSNDAEVQGLNSQYRSQDKPTNVLSFPMNEHGLLGDVILSFETCSKESLEQQKLFVHHGTHLIVHGVLHLLGYNHEEDKDAEEMESLEVKILNSLKIQSPYNHYEEV